MAFSIRRLDHVVLRVADLDRSIAFYRDVLGCREERRVESIALVQMRAGESLIDLIPAPAQPDAGTGNMDHFALRIDPFEEVELRRYLGEHGVAVSEVASRYGAEGSGPSLYIEDPDGNTVELKGPPDS